MNELQTHSTKTPVAYSQLTQIPKKQSRDCD